MVCLTQKLRIRTRNSSLLCGPWAHGQANWNVRSEYLEQRVAAAGWNAREYVFLVAAAAAAAAAAATATESERLYFSRRELRLSATFRA